MECQKKNVNAFLMFIRGVWRMYVFRHDGAFRRLTHAHNLFIYVRVRKVMVAILFPGARYVEVADYSCFEFYFSFRVFIYFTEISILK